MKANEAPEKIYLTTDGNNSFVFTQKRSDNEGIEYTSNDVFIEKACEFMCNNIDKHITIYHNNTWRKRDEFIEAFRQFMKRE